MHISTVELPRTFDTPKVHENRKKTNLPVLALVVPCYNEELVLPETERRLRSVLVSLKERSKIHASSFIYFVDDGSTDRTWDIVKELHQTRTEVKGLKLSRNSGHQNALIAGLLSVSGRMDCVITIDADLQDDPGVIEKMVDCYLAGYDVVYGVRRERNNDSLFKKYSALAFYRLMRRLGKDIIYNHADYRLVSKRVVECLSDFKEVNLFLRGIVPLIGFKSTSVLYDRMKRYAGTSKYPLRKMLSFAFDGITSFSVTPLRMITVSGFFIASASAVVGLWVLISVIRGLTVPGWASTVLPIYIIGGFHLFCTGLIGEYVAKIYKEVKARPRFIRDAEVF